MSEVDDLNEQVGIEVMTITLDSSVGVPQVDLGQVTVATSITIFESILNHLKMVMPTPTIVSDEVVIMSGGYYDEDDEDYEDYDIEDSD